MGAGGSGTEFGIHACRRFPIFGGILQPADPCSVPARHGLRTG